MSETRTIDVLDAQGSRSGSAELPAELFDVTANIPLIHQVVVAQLAAARQGTHSTKTRADVRGGGRKPHRQKGTGRARQGSVRAPQYVGGGVVHGPHPHGYAQRTPKKMIAAAIRGALSDRARDGAVHVVTELVTGEVPSTKAALAALAAVSTSDKVLVVIGRDEDVAWLSLRNVITVHAIAVDQLNAYDILVNDEIVFTEAALHTYVSGRTAGRSVKAVATESEAALEPASLQLVLKPSPDQLSNDVPVVEPTTVRIVEPSNDDLVREPSNDDPALASTDDESVDTEMVAEDVADDEFADDELAEGETK